jgi:hypothetical protein
MIPDCYINSGLGNDYVSGGTNPNGVADNDLLIVDYSSNTYIGVNSGISSYTHNDTLGEARGYFFLTTTVATTQTQLISLISIVSKSLGGQPTIVLSREMVKTLSLAVLGLIPLMVERVTIL